MHAAIVAEENVPTAIYLSITVELWVRIGRKLSCRPNGLLKDSAPGIQYIYMPQTGL